MGSCAGWASEAIQVKLMMWWSGAQLPAGLRPAGRACSHLDGTTVVTEFQQDQPMPDWWDITKSWHVAAFCMHTLFKSSSANPQALQTLAS